MLGNICKAALFLVCPNLNYGNINIAFLRYHDSHSLFPFSICLPLADEEMFFINTPIYKYSEAPVRSGSLHQGPALQTVISSVILEKTDSEIVPHPLRHAK